MGAEGSCKGRMGRHQRRKLLEGGDAQAGVMAKGRKRRRRIMINCCLIERAMRL